MSNSSDSKRVFIGGITGGIGSSLAENLLSENFTVGGFGRDDSKLQKLRDSNSDLQLHEANSTDSEAVNRVFEEFSEKNSGLDVYVHCVGSVFLKPAHLTKDEEWKEVIDTNLNSAFYALRSAVNIMRKQKSGVVLLISSVAAQSGLSNHEAIAAAKGGIEGLVRSAAATYSANGVRVNGLALGLVETPATEFLTSSEQSKKISERMHPLGRLGDAKEVASLLGWMSSKNAEWVTGQIWTMDGGVGTIVPKPRA